MKKGLFLSLIAAVAMLASCSKTLPQPEEVTVNPSPLAVVGNKVNADITGTFPVKKFAKKGVLTVTPVLKYEGGEAVGTPVTYVGEKAKENGTMVSYAEGGKYSQSCSFDYVPAMDKSELYLRFTAKVGNKEVEVPELKVADGLVATAKLASACDNKSVVTPDKFQRVIQQMQEADQNERKAINKLEVSGYASPDGGMDLNEKLAGQRQKNAQKFLQKQLKRDKVKTDIASDITAEDWAGFQALLENSNMQDKELVLRVLSMYTDPEEREAQIKNLSSVYKTIAEDILPALRRSRLILTTDLIGKSDDEIKECLANDPSQLNVEEMLYAATLTSDNAEKVAIYQKVAAQFNDYRAYNNMGMIYFGQGNVAEARRAYNKALTIEPQNPDVNFNAGVAAMAEGDLAKAEEHLGRAAGTQGNLAAAMGTLYTMKGDYKAAKAAYGQNATNNAAVQQILNEDYAGARQTLANVKEPNGVTAYLQAVVGARTNDRNAVYSNMKVAVAKDASLKARALNDIEFAKFAEDVEFQAIVK